MRQIKFRAFDDGKMIYFKDIEHLDKEDHQVLKLAKFFCNVRNDSHIMQATGLTDKNGKEIYEGDIVRVWIGATIDEWEHVEPLSIVFKAGCFCAVNERRSKILNDLCKDNPLNKLFECEVIGNVHENPHLLNP